jgi:uncharacterized protein
MGMKDTIEKLKDCQNEIETRYHARLKGVFGSRVRGDNIASSDLDVLVSFDTEADLFDLVALSDFLEARLQCPVDLVPIDSLRDEIREKVLAEAVYL